MAVNSKETFFIFLAVVCFITTFFVKNRLRYFLFLMVLFASLPVGFIFRHNNGIYIMDPPLLVVLIYGVLVHRKFRLYCGIPAVGMIVWYLLSGLSAPRIDITISELTRLIRAYLAFLCVINFTKTKKDLNMVLLALIIGLALQSVIGYFQWHHGSLGLYMLGEASFGWRARGLFLHPSFFGNYLILLLPIIFRLFVFYKPPQKIYTYFYGCLFMVGMGALYGSYARGPWIALVGAFMLMVLFTLFQKRFYPKVVSATAFIVVCATIFLIYYTPTVIRQFTSDYRQASTDVRMPLNKVAMRIVADNPLLGVGVGNYELVSYQYIKPEDINEDITHVHLQQMVHNSYLLIASEAGVPCFILFCWFLIYVFRKGWKVIKIRHGYIANIGLGIITGFLALLISLLGSPDYQEHQVLMMIWVLAAYLVALSNVRVAKKSPRKSRTSIKKTVPYNKELNQALVRSR